ncbi:hypothetical protein BpHYR1_009390, partial [Brachionus plicatilis]
IDFDDFKGNFCNQGTYPLMKILNHILSDSQCSFTTKQSTSLITFASSTKKTTHHHHTHHTQTSSLPTPVTHSHLPSDTCSGKENKYITSQSGCEYFRVCMKGFLNPIATVKCPNNLWFHLNQQTCVKTKPFAYQVSLSKCQSNIIITKLCYNIYNIISTNKTNYSNIFKPT